MNDHDFNHFQQGSKDVQFLDSHHYMIYFHFHGAPFVVVATTALNYLASNRKMRQTLCREVKSHIMPQLSVIDHVLVI